MTPVIEFYEKLFSDGGVWANFINDQGYVPVNCCYTGYI